MQQWHPYFIGVNIPKDKQVELKATGLNGEVYAQCTVLGADVTPIDPQGYGWTYWREANETEEEINDSDILGVCDVN